MGGWGWSGPGWMYSLAPLFVLWSLTWKGLALWHAAGRKQGWWFIALLVFNTAGILEIIYLFGVLKLKTNALFPGKK
ncbi:hypothetical protein HY633_01560 [Candidatus Uhrbacteria bacterium]|nr:hypothetical protein [Candidatus Uhrbacteria bacterium]